MFSLRKLLSGVNYAKFSSADANMEALLKASRGVIPCEAMKVALKKRS